jgi:hypothetical protein
MSCAGREGASGEGGLLSLVILTVVILFFQIIPLCWHLKQTYYILLYHIVVTDVLVHDRCSS